MIRISFNLENEMEIQNVILFFYKNGLEKICNETQNILIKYKENQQDKSSFLYFIV